MKTSTSKILELPQIRTARKILRLLGTFLIALLFLRGQIMINALRTETFTVELKELISFVLIIVGFIIRFWSNGYRKGFKEISTTSFVACGPYAHLRHPLYLGDMMIIIGFLLNGFSGIMTYISLALTIIIFNLIAVLEEKKLISTIGLPYKNYLSQIPRFIPKIKTSLPISTIPFRIETAIPELIKMTIVILFFIGVDRLVD